MKISSMFVVVLLVISLCESRKDCNATQFHFWSEFSLGKQDELNKTFGLIEAKLGYLTDISWKNNDTSTYYIMNAKPTFFYLKTKQQAVIAGHDTIVIKGGSLEVDIAFDWKRVQDGKTRFGTAKAIGISAEIIFDKKVVNDDNFIRYSLDYWENVTFTNNFNITRINPPDTSEEDQKNIAILLNGHIGVYALKYQLQDDIETLYSYYLNNSLHNENFPIDENFTYTWQDPVTSRGNITIPFSRRAYDVDLEREGLSLSFDVQIQNYADWQCGDYMPLTPLDPRIYGGIQEFYTFKFYKQTLDYALKAGHFNTTLTKELWESRMFQFFAGDLYEVIPKVAEKYYATEVVSGKCVPHSTDLGGIKLYRASSKTFNVTMMFDCSLKIGTTPIANFDVGVEWEIEGHAKSKELNFKVKSFYDYITILREGEYIVENQDLAKLMVKHSLNRAFESHVFGSNWPLTPRNYPQFIVEHDYAAVYDSTHVETQ